MMTLIIGGSGSGKSAFAEAYMEEHYPSASKYYIATMEAYDTEARDKIHRHRIQRQDKDYTTIEQYRDIEDASMKMNGKKKIALLECISNLVANEMFLGDTVVEEQKVLDKVLDGIQSLRNQLDDFVIVTNNVFEDGNEYDASTMGYLRVLGSINSTLARMADLCIEVVLGIPIILSQGEAFAPTSY